MCAKILKTVDINQVWYKKDVSLSAKSRGKMIMNKIIGLAVLLFCLSGCVGIMMLFIIRLATWMWKEVVRLWRLGRVI